MRATLSTTYDYRIHYKETGAVWKLSSLFLEHIPFHTHELIFFCIGTDRSTGDALVHYRFSSYRVSTFPFPVIGTLGKPATRT